MSDNFQVKKTEKNKRGDRIMHTPIQSMLSMVMVGPVEMFRIAVD